MEISCLHLISTSLKKYVLYILYSTNGNINHYHQKISSLNLFAMYIIAEYSKGILHNTVYYCDNIMPSTEPVSTGPERIISIDSLRGLAVLGILLINIQGFSMISAAYINPAAYGDLTGWNYMTWFFSYTFADSKFLALFSILFGASMVLIQDKRSSYPEYETWKYHLRRLSILFIIGLVHAFLVWPGDILVAYAVCGSLLLSLIRLPARQMLLIALILLSIPSIQMAKLHSEMQEWDHSDWQYAQRDWLPAKKDYQSEIQAYRGSWQEQQKLRASEVVTMYTQSFPYWLSWRIAGMMLIGMALFKLGILTGHRTTRFYKVLALSGLGTGLPLIACSAYFMSGSSWSLKYYMDWGYQLNYWGSLPVVAGYIAVILLMYQTGSMQWLSRSLAKIGRMALSNYLLQSVICTLVFYGHGLGLFGQVQRSGQFLIVISVWIFQFIFSILWLRYFRHGPIEWLWRNATHLQWQKMRHALSG